MMNEEDRRKVFWLLKKYSSYTAWKTLADAYHDFVKEYKYAVSHANDLKGEDAQGWLNDALKVLVDGQIGFEKGIPLLRRGDLSPFKDNSCGFLGDAAKAVVYAHRIMDPEEYVFDWMKNKEKVIATHQQVDLTTKGLFGVRERAPGESAAFGQKTVFHPIDEPFNFPPYLPEVPVPSDVVIETNSEVLTNGIYEPEWEISQGLMGSLMGKQPDIDKGCMNYLLAGTTAPYYKDGMGEKEKAVRWRLIWEDNRYKDGIIPEEEKEYLAPPDNAGGLQKREPAQRCEGGQPCPRAGYWSVWHESGSRRYFAQGEIMPGGFTLGGERIWYWDDNQSD